MAMDLTAAGPHVIEGAGDGLTPATPLRQTVQIDQSNTGALPVSSTALGAPTDTANAASMIGQLKQLVALLTAAAASAMSDGSGSVVAGGAAQPLFSGTAPPRGYLVQNTSSFPMWINEFGVAAAGGASILLNPGMMYSTPPGAKPAGAVSLFGGVTGQAFAARKW